ncbi:UbiX family flavin prenyltransferase [Siculibacillus lacustris]|uniref:Flavin prenyltransferase UbiX n=1 Tax=Siculibacillus lacustris TaxID=1549641 RepID=A0A4Q9VXD6_9HYPH|nr:UbiX family flavin prenyltransferase [Siculibacillus lacustris]TBW41053.1 UbiX family flavin prenyltransferase [Siculibacillus lacustris]
MTAPARLVLALTGASGAAIGLRIAEILAATAIETHLVVTAAGERTLALEVGPDALSRLEALVHTRHAADDIAATLASGSFATCGMIVAPCSMRCLGAIAGSLASDLVVRAADVHLKERRPLVLLARESPLHLGHIRAMAAVTEYGAIVAPPVPAFYLKPVSVAEIVDQIARRALDLLRLPGPAFARAWGGPDGGAGEGAP